MNSGETAFLIILCKGCETSFQIMTIGGETSFWLGGETSFQNMNRGETSFLIMKWVRNVFLKYSLGAKLLSKIWFGCEMSFWNMVWVRNVFLKYGLGAKRLSKIWFGCETSSWTMKTGAKRLSYLWGGGETSFLSMSWGRNGSLNNGANWLWGEKSVYHINYCLFVLNVS